MDLLMIPLLILLTVGIIGGPVATAVLLRRLTESKRVACLSRQRVLQVEGQLLMLTSAARQVLAALDGPTQGTAIRRLALAMDIYDNRGVNEDRTAADDTAGP